MADTQITGTLSADESISGSLTANEGIDASLTPDEEVSGALEVKRTRSIPTNLDDLGDVDLDDVQEGDVLQYDGEKWVNGEGSHGGGTWGTITGTLSDQTDLQNALDAKISSSEKGANNGVATLDNTGRVPSSQLPSYVDDVLEYASLSAFPATSEVGKIYIALDTNKTYRWSGSTYVEISESLALGETTGTAYEGSKGKANADAIAKAYLIDDTAENAIDDTDYFPFYDTSATAKRKTLWSNIKTKLKAYFDGIYSTFSGSYNDLTDEPDLSVYAPLASPALTGTPTAPTANAGTNSTRIATTAFVQTAINGYKHPYLLIREGVTASAGSDVRIPASGTDSKIYPGLQSVYIPVAYSDTPIKFSQIKVHSGYLNITMAQEVTNIDMGVMIIT